MTVKQPLGNTRAVSIILDSGIQFLDFSFSSQDERLPRDWDCYDEVSDGAWASLSEYALINRDSEPIGKSRTGAAISYSVTRRQILDFVTGRWLPLPLFRRRDGSALAQGPTNWARIRTVALEEPDADGNDYRVVVALDTSSMQTATGQAYLAPELNDAGRTFECVTHGANLDAFLHEEWVEDWLLELFEEMYVDDKVRRTGRRMLERPSTEELRDEAAGPAEPALRFAAFLDLIERIELFPPFRIAAGGTLDPVDCDLVLDVGNSRTCGLVIESDPDYGADVSKAVKLELRDLNRPEHVYAEPFESRIEFALVEIGKSDLSVKSGRSDAFEWPTVARVGFEAARLAGERVGNEGSSGMSSPKRYLWSSDPPAQQWRFNAASMRGDEEPFAAQGALPALVTDEGVPLHTLPRTERAAAFEARYSRSSLFAFALVEIFLHALTMINSPAHRLSRENSENPRRLRRVIMTMPSAMPLAERAILRQRAEEARDLAYLGLGVVGFANDDAGVDWSAAPFPKPEVVLQWDEASATQVVYLYTRVVRHFSGHARACFNTLRRPGSQHDHELRVATLDIGGGTTDLVITDFDCEGQGNSVTIFPEQRFREGFNVAGDDIVFRVIQDHVLMPIERAVAASGVTSAPALSASLFGGNRGDMDVADRLRRQQFALQIATPIALGLISVYEQADSLEQSHEEMAFGEFFPPDHQPNAVVIDYINAAVASHGGADFDLHELSFPVDLKLLDQTIRSVMGQVLDVLSEIIWHYGTDVLLLSGRPSRLNAVQALLSESLPMMVGNIVALHGFRVGQWYPYRDYEGRIGDPKTTAAVGAMLCAMSEGSIEGFNFRSDRIRLPSSTARFIGKLDGNGKIPLEDVYYEELNLDDDQQDLSETPFEFRGPMPLGFRQFPNDWWPATRLYWIDYMSDADRRELHARTPIKVALRRETRRGSELLSENLRIDLAEDVEGRNVRHRLRLKLQTLVDGDGYWLDTGILRRGE
ncbi:MAG: virulence factor SrfB [Pseudomonadota bacterium]